MTPPSIFPALVAEPLMPNDRCCPHDWTLVITALLLFGIWLPDPAVLSALPVADEPSAEIAPPVASAAGDARSEMGQADGRERASQGAPIARAARQMRAVPPVGWRRTTRGWERMPLMPPPPPSINELIDRQVETESRWAIHGMLERIRRWHPLSLAAAQLAVAGLIVLAASRQSPVRRGVAVTPVRSTPAPAVPHTN